MSEKELQNLMNEVYQKGVQEGIRIMQQKILLSCENGMPLDINGKAVFIKSDIHNLRNIFADLEEEVYTI